MTTPQDRTGRGDPVAPPTAVRWLPVLAVTFGLSMVIDITTDWPMVVRWILALAGGVVAQVISLRIWMSRRR